LSPFLNGKYAIQGVDKDSVEEQGDFINILAKADQAIIFTEVN
jgi:hypothetical protein